jgi:hypothetical protein
MEKQMSLTPYERETSIVLNDEDDFAIVTTHQRGMLRRLRANPAAVLLEGLDFQGTPGGQFKVPAKLISVRRPRVKRELTPAQRREAGERMRKARAAR